MLWGDRQVDAWTSNILQTIAQNKVTTVLGMNEYVMNFVAVK